MSPPQEKFLIELLIDCQLYTPRILRNDFIKRRINREIKDLDELSTSEASRLIYHLLERRTNERENRKSLPGQQSFPLSEEKRKEEEEKKEDEE
jgi:hypothetical protein